MADFTVKSRDEWRTAYLRSLKIRDPDADTRDGTQPHIDASCLADQLVVLGGMAQQNALAHVLAGKNEQQLAEFAADHGITWPDATGAIGWALMGDATATGGTTPLYGDELSDVETGMIFRFTGSGTYTAGEPFPVAAKSTGPATNLAADAILQWSAPRAGCDPFATVQEQPDGSGLSGGREKPTLEEFVLIVREALSNPGSDENDATYVRLIEDSIGHGVQVEKAFTYPCVLGPGTTALTFTLKAGRLGASRIPNTAQLDAVAAYIGEKLSRDNGYFMCPLVLSQRDVYLKVDWSPGAGGWTDLEPWPPYYATTTAAPNVANIVVSAVTDSTHFTLESASGAYTGAAQPSAGKTLGFYDKTGGKFYRKRILSIVGAGPWDITCDTTSGASDTSFSPDIGQPAVPWSDSLDLLVTPVASYLATFGPGEQFASFFDDGSRKKRQPRPPKQWPIQFTTRVTEGVFDLSAVDSVSLAEGDGETVAIGTPATFSRLMELRWLAAYPKS